VISYGTMPKTSPRGGFPVKTEVTFSGTFGGEREFGITGKPSQRPTMSPARRGLGGDARATTARMGVMRSRVLVMRKRTFLAVLGAATLGVFSV